MITARMSLTQATVKGTIAHTISQTQHNVAISMMKHLLPQKYAAPVEGA